MAAGRGAESSLVLENLQGPPVSQGPGRWEGRFSCAGSELPPCVYNFPKFIAMPQSPLLAEPPDEILQHKKSLCLHRVLVADPSAPRQRACPLVPAAGHASWIPGVPGRQEAAGSHRGRALGAPDRTRRLPPQRTNQSRTNKHRLKAKREGPVSDTKENFPLGKHWVTEDPSRKEANGKPAPVRAQGRRMGTGTAWVPPPRSPPARLPCSPGKWARQGRTADTASSLQCDGSWRGRPEG